MCDSTPSPQAEHDDEFDERWLARSVAARLSSRVTAPSETEARAWLNAGLSRPGEIAPWFEIEVRAPAMRPAGMTHQDAQRMAEFGVETASREWAGIGRACLPVYKTLAGTGRSTRETVTLALALGEASDREQPRSHDTGCTAPGCECGRDRSLRTDAALVAAEADLDWANLALCLRAGMPLDESLAHVRAGKDMEPVEVMAALG